MNKATWCLVALLSFSSIADSEKEDAPKEVITETITLCKAYAVEDDIPKAELAEFLLSCVNEELTSQGYNEVDSID